jgi:paraquat-inducible protein A
VRALAALNWAGHVLLALGLVAPCMTITPHAEPHEGLARWLGLMKEPKTWSILGGIGKLLRGGNVAVGVALLAFSVLVPVAKLVVVRAALDDARGGRGASPALRVAVAIGKYSMVDVYVVALLVVAAQTLPGGTTIELRWGAFAFAGAALLAIPVSARVARLAARAP